MPGVKGMVAAIPRTNAIRNKIWQSIRIMRRFTTPDLCRTSGAKISNTRKFVRRLAEHGYIRPVDGYVSGQAGIYKGWMLCREPKKKPRNYPTKCDVCNRPLGQPCLKGGDDDE